MQKKDLHSRQKLTVREVLKEVRKAKRHPVPLEEYRISHTGSDDGKLQREALRISQRHSRTGHFRLSIEGWDTIKRRLSDYPAITQEYWNYPPRESSMSFALAQKIQPNPKRTKTKVGPATVLPLLCIMRLVCWQQFRFPSPANHWNSCIQRSSGKQP